MLDPDGVGAGQCAVRSLGPLYVGLDMSRREHHDGKNRGDNEKEPLPRGSAAQHGHLFIFCVGGTATCIADDPALGVGCVW